MSSDQAAPGGPGGAPQAGPAPDKIAEEWAAAVAESRPERATEIADPSEVQRYLNSLPLYNLIDLERGY